MTLKIHKSRQVVIHTNCEKKEELQQNIELVTKSLRKQYFKNSLFKLSNKNIENAEIICNYIIAEQTEINIKDSTKESKIKILIWLSNHFQDKKSFKDMTKYDILDFLNIRRKSSSEDPSQKCLMIKNAKKATKSLQDLLLLALR